MKNTLTAFAAGFAGALIGIVAATGAPAKATETINGYPNVMYYGAQLAAIEYCTDNPQLHNDPGTFQHCVDENAVKILDELKTY